MGKVEVVSIKPTGTFIGSLELSEVTLKRGDLQVTQTMYWDNPDLLGLVGTFEEILEGDTGYECPDT